MEKFLTLIFVLTLLLLAACGTTDTPQEQETREPQILEPTIQPEPIPEPEPEPQLLLTPPEEPDWNMYISCTITGLRTQLFTREMLDNLGDRELISFIDVNRNFSFSFEPNPYLLGQRGLVAEVRNFPDNRLLLVMIVSCD